jgi:hypothetical protein
VRHILVAARRALHAAILSVSRLLPPARFSLSSVLRLLPTARCHLPASVDYPSDPSRASACNRPLTSARCSPSSAPSRLLPAATCQLPPSAPITSFLIGSNLLFHVVHITELQADINRFVAFAWTDPNLTPGSTPVKRVHLLDLRTALDQAYAAAVPPKTHAPYTDPTITSGATPIKASHLSELRSLVRGLE